ncbi:MAG: BrnA antitoxin family protein [Methylococcales bacterium]
MNRKSTIVRYTLNEIEAKIARGESRTRKGAPEAESLGEEFWSKAKIVMPRAKKAVSLRLDADVLDWFKAQGPGYLTRINAVLRSFVEAKSTVRDKIKKL